MCLTDSAAIYVANATSSANFAFKDVGLHIRSLAASLLECNGLGRSWFLSALVARTQVKGLSRAQIWYLVIGGKVKKAVATIIGTNLCAVDKVPVRFA